ncbi:MAG: DJ-1/PfpI family protein [Clostridiales bacterium]|nr:DJ-1/PfpI family protein [Clostridiales bacterium]
MVYLFLADGFETIEALAVVDMLRRAKIDICTVGVTDKTVMSSHNIPVTADITADEFTAEDLEAVVLPGGMPGTLNLEKSGVVQQAVDYAVDNKKYVCAICAAPSILGHRGLLNGKNAICFPGFEDALTGAKISDEYVVTDGKFITARGAGVAVNFGLEIVSRLSDKETAEKVRDSIQCR